MASGLLTSVLCCNVSWSLSDQYCRYRRSLQKVLGYNGWLFKERRFPENIIWENGRLLPVDTASIHFGACRPKKYVRNIKQKQKEMVSQFLAFDWLALLRMINDSSVGLAYFYHCLRNLASISNQISITCNRNYPTKWSKLRNLTEAVANLESEFLRIYAKGRNSMAGNFLKWSLLQTRFHNCCCCHSPQP